MSLLLSLLDKLPLTPDLCHLSLPQSEFSVALGDNFVSFHLSIQPLGLLLTFSESHNLSCCFLNECVILIGVGYGERGRERKSPSRYHREERRGEKYKERKVDQYAVMLKQNGTPWFWTILKLIKGHLISSCSRIFFAPYLSFLTQKRYREEKLNYNLGVSSWFVCVFYPFLNQEFVFARVRNNIDAIRGLQSFSMQFLGNMGCCLALLAQSEGVPSFFSFLLFSVPLTQRQKMTMAQGRGFQK